MEQIVSEYRKLLDLLIEEEQNVPSCLQGELLDMYRDILTKEREQIERNLRIIQQIS